MIFISALICSALITSCGHCNNDTSSGGINFKLPNGSTLSVPAAGTNLSVASGESTSTAITLSGGTPGMDVLLSSSVTPSTGNKAQLLSDTLESQIVVTFGKDVLISGGIDSSKILVTVDPATAPGTYLINLKASYFYDSKSTRNQGIGTLVVVISAPGPTPKPIAGSVLFSPESHNIESGSSFTTILRLDGSSNIESFTVTLTAAAGVTVSPSSCELSSVISSCNVTIAGVSTGAVNVTATTTVGYTINPFVANVIPTVNKIIFVTAAGYTGNLGGFLGADAKCNADSNKPSGGATYKALLAGRSDVLVNGATYYAATGEVIGIAEVSESGWFPSSNSNYIDNGTRSDLFMWTGGAGTATPDVSMTCNNWTSSNGMDNGVTGLGNAVSVVADYDMTVDGLTGVGGWQGDVASWLSACPYGSTNCNDAVGSFARARNFRYSDTAIISYSCDGTVNVASSGSLYLYCVAQPQ